MTLSSHRLPCNWLPIPNSLSSRQSWRSTFRQTWKFQVGSKIFAPVPDLGQSRTQKRCPRRFLHYRQSDSASLERCRECFWWWAGRRCVCKKANTNRDLGLIVPIPKPLIFEPQEAHRWGSTLGKSSRQRVGRWLLPRPFDPTGLSIRLG